MFVVFHASGTDFDPEQFAATFDVKGCSFWLRGQPRRPGTRTPETSGFRLPLPDAETSAAVAILLRAFLKNSAHWLEALAERGASGQFDIGMTVGSEEAFSASVAFDAALLREMADKQVGLVFSAYPSSD